MKKLVSLLLCAALTLMSGCAYAAASSQREADTYDLYFREADLSAAPGGDALRAERIYLPAAAEEETAQLAETLLTALLQGPMDETLQSPIPAGTALLSLEVKGARASVDLSSPYGTLSGVALTLADYAVTLTLTQIQAISEVNITVRGRELGYRDNQSFTRRDVLLSSTEDVVGTVTVTLYFLDAAGVLAPAERTLDLYEGDTQVAAVVKALENGPEDKNLSNALPESFRVKSVWLEENVCYVNLSSASLPDLPEGAPLLTAVRALVRSLWSLDTVGEVQFLVDGEFADTYGPVNVRDPYTG